MSIRIVPAVFASVLLFALSFLPKVAHAALDACGGVFLTSSAQCEFKQTQDCTTTCQPVAVDQSCAAELYTSCNSSCTATPTTDCTSTCEPVCTTQCTTDAAAESSDDTCLSNCSTDCDTKCTGPSPLPPELPFEVEQPDPSQAGRPVLSAS